MNIAVITGASSGMGRNFVYAIDKEFTLDEIWVIARREKLLEELKDKTKIPRNILGIFLFVIYAFFLKYRFITSTTPMPKIGNKAVSSMAVFIPTCSGVKERVAERVWANALPETVSTTAPIS